MTGVRKANFEVEVDEGEEKNRDKLCHGEVLGVRFEVDLL